MIPGGLPSLTDAVEGPHSPPAQGQSGAAPGTPQLSSSSAFEQWAAQGNPWRTGPGQRCLVTMLGLAKGAAHVANVKTARAACRSRVQRRAARCAQGGGACRPALPCRTATERSPAQHGVRTSVACKADPSSWQRTILASTSSRVDCSAWEAGQPHLLRACVTGGRGTPAHCDARHVFAQADECSPAKACGGTGTCWHRLTSSPLHRHMH